MMKKVVSQIFLLCCFLTTVTSQVKEFGLFAGGAYYRGELNRTHFSQTDYAIGGIFKQDFPNDRISLRFQLLFNQVKAGSKGGKPGQWSARKAQLVAQKYKAAGGGYKGGKGKKQKDLKRWGKEKWMTRKEYEKKKKD